MGRLPVSIGLECKTGAMDALTEESILELRAVFDAQDPSGSGYLEGHQVKAAITELSKKSRSKYKDADDAEVEAMIRYFTQSGGVDAMQRKSINFPEFLYSMGKRSRDSDTDEDLTRLFNRLDTSGDGVVETRELKNALHTLGRQLGLAHWNDGEIDNIIREGDANRDGVLDFGEFKRIMTSERAMNSANMR